MTLRKVLCGSAFVVAVAAMGATPASAEDELTREVKGTAKPDRTIGAQVTVKYSSSGNSGGGSGSLTSTDSNWSPPGCWYAPQWNSSEFRQLRQGIYFSAVHDPDGQDYRGEISDANERYAKDGYHDEDAKEGMYWGAVQNPDAPYDEQWACDKDPFWVKNGDKPAVQNAVSPEILAGLAYKQIKVPGTEVSLAPAGASKVNLPTWAWLDKGMFKPVSVTAELDFPGFHMEATTTAEPRGLALEPGTSDAEVLPSSGVCNAGADGTVGEAYAPGKAGRTPPCGVTYLRSSEGGTFDLRATTRWRITWTGTGGAAGDLPEGEYGHDEPVVVQEVQAVNR